MHEVDCRSLRQVRRRRWCRRPTTRAAMAVNVFVRHVPVSVYIRCRCMHVPVVYARACPERPGGGGDRAREPGGRFSSPGPPFQPRPARPARWRGTECTARNTARAQGVRRSRSDAFRGPAVTRLSGPRGHAPFGAPRSRAFRGPAVTLRRAERDIPQTHGRGRASSRGRACNAARAQGARVAVEAFRSTTLLAR